MLNSKVIISSIKDPFINLALENYLLENVNSNSRILLMWDNNPCVVLGRFQNPWIECNLSLMKSDGIQLVRRQSGGGTVYHDDGNINFSIISDKSLHDKRWSHKVIVNALKSIEVFAFATERGDIRLEEDLGRKISGSAFKEKKTSAFHHGTMLVSSNLELLNAYINSNKKDLETKSIASVRSVVANITEQNEKIENKDVYNCFSREFAAEVPIEHKIEWFDLNSQLYNKVINGDYYKKIIDKKWIYNETPKFNISTKSHNWSIDLIVKKTIIEEINIFNELLHPSLIETVSKTLLKSSIFEAKCSIQKIELYFDFKDELDILISWFDEYFELNALP